MADRPDDGEGWVTEELRLPVDTDQPDGARRPDAFAVPSEHRSQDAGSQDPRPGQSRTASAHSRRQRRQTLTFLAFFGVILLVGALALAAYYDRITLPFGSGRPVALPDCPAAPSSSVQPPGETSVNVFNSSSRTGLALSVARDLQKRGFLVPTTPANDPAKTKMTTMAVIRHGPTGLVAAQTLATVVAGEVTYVQDDRTSSDVDLLLGATFALAPLTTPSASAAAAPAPSPTCTVTS